MQKTEKISLVDAPKIAGKKPQQFKLLVNGEHCQSVVSIDGLLDDVVKAWRIFRHVLAGEHASTLSFIPADLQLGCDLALNIFFPAWFLDYGLPIESMEVGGKGMRLVDYVTDTTVDSRLFKVPDGYHRYTAK